MPVEPGRIIRRTAGKKRQDRPARAGVLVRRRSGGPRQTSGRGSGRPNVVFRASEEHHRLSSLRRESDVRAAVVDT